MSAIKSRMTRVLSEAGELKSLGDARLQHPDSVKHFKQLQKTIEQYLAALHKMQQAEDEFRKQLSSDLNKIGSTFGLRGGAELAGVLKATYPLLRAVQDAPTTGKDVVGYLKRLLGSDELRIGASRVVARDK